MTDLIGQIEAATNTNLKDTDINSLYSRVLKAYIANQKKDVSLRGQWFHAIRLGYIALGPNSTDSMTDFIEGIMHDNKVMTKANKKANPKFKLLGESLGQSGIEKGISTLKVAVDTHNLDLSEYLTENSLKVKVQELNEALKDDKESEGDSEGDSEGGSEDLESEDDKAKKLEAQLTNTLNFLEQIGLNATANLVRAQVRYLSDDPEKLAKLNNSVAKLITK
jgi:hypothetical protein